MKITNPEALMAASISRRSLVKTSAIGSLALASSAFTLPFSRIAHAAADLASGNVAEKAVWSSCTVNCGSRCLLRLHVKDDTVYWVESDTTGNDEYGNHQVRACLRGRSIRRRMNHPDRLKYPMKRVGKRGEGKFERISWDEALDTIGDNLKRILKDYGNEAVHVLYGTGVDGGNIDVLQQACPQEIWINPIDAQARGIQHGDTVRVFNQNGQMLIPAKVTPRILPGVTAIGQGAWLNADMFGDKVDRGGSINILTSHRPSPLAKGNPSHSNLVQVEKA
ncbi:molybdopterin-dependent oxidoreductase [Salmonella enterica]|nr:molybdopterin-dependent oxidoreductase [Salmonella enterica]